MTSRRTVRGRRARAVLIALIIGGLIGSVGLLSGCSPFGGDQPEPVALPSASSPAPSVKDPADDPALARFYRQKLHWTGCSGIQCARLTVPIDWAAAAGATMEIALGRDPATGERLGALVYNPGGPGVAGVDYVRSAGRIVGRAVREHFDFVSFDPRGTGKSGPIDCAKDRELDRYLAADATPDDAAELTSLAASNREFGEGCLKHSSPEVAHVDTLSVVRDLDVLRAALGESRLSFFGASYGTFIGAWYAQTFPWRVGRMVLDGAVDPSVDLAGYVEGQAQGFDRGLTDYLTWCLKRRDCPFAGTEQEARAQLGKLVDDADATPLPTHDAKRPLTQSLMFTGIGQGLYSDALWDQLTKALRGALSRDGQKLLELADMYNERASNGTYGAVLEANPAIYCLDHGETRTEAQIEAGARELAARFPPLGGFIGWAPLGCSEWPLPAVVQPMRLTAQGAAPILVLGTVGDPATPYEWAKSLASQLSSGRLLTWEGSGHTAYRRGGSCVDDAVDAYLVAGTLPPDGTRCPA